MELLKLYNVVGTTDPSPVHLRDGPMMELVTPTIRQGGVNTVFVMVREEKPPSQETIEHE